MAITATTGSDGRECGVLTGEIGVPDAEEGYAGDGSAVEHFWQGLFAEHVRGRDEAV